MGIWNKMFGKRRAIARYSEAGLRFTEEEASFVKKHQSFYSKEPDGSNNIVTEKGGNAIISQGLRYYAEHLIEEAEKQPSDARSCELLDKAIRASMKAYAFHNLPIQLCNIAGMLEMAGNNEEAKRFYGLFLQEWYSFKPDVVDEIFQKEINIDTDMAIVRAKNRIADL